MQEDILYPLLLVWGNPFISMEESTYWYGGRQGKTQLGLSFIPILLPIERALLVFGTRRFFLFWQTAECEKGYFNIKIEKITGTVTVTLRECKKSH